MTETREAKVTRLWGELASSLRAWFVSRTGDEHEAEDLLSECFLRVHDRFDDVREEERMGAWIRGIARNLLVDWRRSRRGSTTLDGLDPAYEENESGLNTIVASWLAPAIEGLDEVDRESLRLTELKGFSQREAAAHLGITLPALKSRVLRGRKRLRETILACCELEFDRRGGVVAYRARRQPGRGDCSDC